MSPSRLKSTPTARTKGHSDSRTQNMLEMRSRVKAWNACKIDRWCMEGVFSNRSVPHKIHQVKVKLSDTTRGSESLVEDTKWSEGCAREPPGTGKDGSTRSPDMLERQHPTTAAAATNEGSGNTQAATRGDAVPPEIKANDFGGFWNKLADSNSNFVVGENYFV